MEEKQQHGRWKYLMCIWFGIFCFPLIAIIPSEFVKGKKEIRVKFVAQKGKQVGQIYGVRLVKN